MAQEGILRRKAGENSGIEKSLKFLDNAPFETLEKIASNPNSRQYALSHLSKHQDSRIRYAVARNKMASLELLEILSRDEDWTVRYGVARNENTPGTILEKLYHFDMEDRVKKIVLESPNVPYEIWLYAYNDYDPGLRSAAALNLKYAKRD